MHHAPRPLLIAEAANPEWVSVPLVGWSLARALQKATGGHIVTQIRNRDAFLRAGLIEGQDFTAINSEAVARPLWQASELLSMGKGKGWTTKTAIASISYRFFEQKLWRLFKARIQAGEFNVVHRITPLSPTATSSIAAKCNRLGVPFVLGPINGGVPWPPGFDGERRREKEWLSYIRDAYKLLPGRITTLRSASAILCGSRYTASEIPTDCAEKVIYMPENAIDPKRFNLIAQQRTEGMLRGCFIGRMVPYKGPDMLLEAAMPLLQDGRLTLDFIGDGPMLDSLKATCASQGPGGLPSAAVTFHGQLEHREVQAIMAKCNLLTFPSIREFGGGVVLEALALGVVPVIVDYAGPGELITDSTGIKVPIGTRSEIVAGFRNALTKITADPARLPEMADSGRMLAQEMFTWDVKAAQVAQVYGWLRDPGASKPVFPFPG